MNVKVLAREYFQKLLNEKDLSVCDRMLAQDYVDHDAAPTTQPGPGSIKEFVSRFIEDYPDIQVSIEDMLAEGNKVAVRMIWRGTHRESGEKLQEMGILILHFNEMGQLTERWSAYKAIESLEQSPNYEE